MPYTLAHPAFALPLARLGLPTAALAAGSVAPDAPLWAAEIGLGGLLARIGVDYAFTHSASGLVFDVLVAALVLLAWEVVRVPSIAALPLAVRRRVPLPWRSCSVRLTGSLGTVASRLLLVVLALSAGAIIHIALDEFTHIGGFAYRNIDWFASTHAGLHGVKWAQYVGGALGLAALAAALWWRLRAGNPLTEGASMPAGSTRLGRCAVWVGLLLGALVGTLATFASLPNGLAAAAVFAATGGVLCVFAGLLAGSLLWHVQAKRVLGL